MDVENDMNDDSEMDVENADSEDGPFLKDSGIPQYTLQPGLVTTQSDKSPLAYFSRFVTNAMLEDIIEQTKLYSEQYKSSNNITAKSRVSRWLKQEPTVPELLRFIAIILVMGFIKYPSIESHWSKSRPFVCDTFSKVSSYKRVITIILS